MLLQEDEFPEYLLVIFDSNLQAVVASGASTAVEHRIMIRARNLFHGAYLKGFLGYGLMRTWLNRMQFLNALPILELGRKAKLPLSA